MNLESDRRNSAQKKMYTENFFRFIILVLHNSNTAKIVFSENLANDSSDWLSLHEIYSRLPGICWVNLKFANEDLFKHEDEPGE